MLKFSTFEELLENEGLKKKAAKSGISLGTLKKVYNRGMAAWKTGHRPGTTPQQWGMARVNSYIGKGKGTYYGADSDLSGKGKKKSKKESVDEARVTSIAFRKKNAMVNPMDKKNISDMAKDKKYKGNTSALMRDVKKKYPDQHHSKTVQDIYKRHAETNEATVKEISKGLAMRYIGKAARDVYHKGQQQGADDAISRLGGPTKPYKKSPERKAAKRVAGIDRATKITSMRPLSYPIGRQGDLKRLKKNEATTSDAERKAIDDFIKKGKMKKLKPGYAQGYHGKSDPAAGMKGMMDKGDTKAFGTKKKVGSMK